jgi:hypothetical protein
LINKIYNGLSRGDFFISILKKGLRDKIEHPGGLKKAEYSNNFAYSVSSNISVFSKNGIHILFSGNLFVDNPAEIIFNNYILNKKDAFKDLNGKFAFCLIDENQRVFFMVTDRVNSYKIYYKSDDLMIRVGTDLDYFNKTNEKLDLGAVGSFLINSAPMKDKTIYKDILKVPAGSYVKFELNDLSKKITRYWKIEFTDEYKNIKPRDLIEELKWILIRSFKRRLSDNKKILVSFSGGSDSRGLLALLTCKELNYENIEIFTHKYGNVEIDDPTSISQQIAEKKGLKIKVLDEYSNKIENFIKLNVKLGKGNAHFCTDVDAWESLKSGYSSHEYKMFVGDIIDGVPEYFRGDYSRALNKNYIYPPSYLNSYRSIFIEDYFDKIFYEYQNDYEQIIEESREYENVLDSMWHTYLDQRVSNTLNVYRENFISYFIDVEMPYYDNEVLDFLTKLPLEQRLYKNIFVETYKRIDPEIMNFKYSSYPGRSINWDIEIKKNKESLSVFNSKSRLDPIISEKEVINHFESLSDSGTGSNYTKHLYNIHKTINKVFPNYYRFLLSDKITNKISTKLRNKSIKYFYLKYVILRGALNYQPDELIE